MRTIGSVRRLGQAASGRGFERLLEQLVERARMDPARVASLAAKRGLPLRGPDPLAQLHSLRVLPVHTLDDLALGVARSHTLVAGAQGFVTGLGGIASLPLTISADTVGALYWAVRATSGIMHSYGFETETEVGVARLRVELLLALGVNDVTVGGRRVGLERIARQVLSTPESHHLLVAGGRQLLLGLSTRAVHGRATRLVPVVGGAISGAINAGMVRGVTGRARGHVRGLLLDWQREQWGHALPAPPVQRWGARDEPRALGVGDLPALPPPPPVQRPSGDDPGR